MPATVQKPENVVIDWPMAPMNGALTRPSSLPFSDMTPANRAAALAWAQRHEWGADAVMSEDGVMFGCAVFIGHAHEARARVETRQFTCFHDLARWAGY